MSLSSSLIQRHSTHSPKITFPNPSIKTRSNPNPSSRISLTNLRFALHRQLSLRLKLNGVQTGNGGGGKGGGVGYCNGGWWEDDKGRFGSNVDRFLLLTCGALFLTLIYLIGRSDKKDDEEVREQREPLVELKITTKMLNEYRRFRNVVSMALNLGEEFMVEELKELTDNIDSKAQELENYRRQKLLAAAEDKDQVTTTNVGGSGKDQVTTTNVRGSGKDQVTTTSVGGGGDGGKSLEGAQDGGAKLVQLKRGESASLTVVGGEVRELNRGEGAQIEILFSHGGKLLINNIKSEEK